MTEHALPWYQASLVIMALANAGTAMMIPDEPPLTYEVPAVNALTGGSPGLSVYQDARSVMYPRQYPTIAVSGSQTPILGPSSSSFTPRSYTNEFMNSLSSGVPNVIVTSSLPKFVHQGESTNFSPYSGAEQSMVQSPENIVITREERPLRTVNGGFTQTSLNAGFPPTTLNAGFTPTSPNAGFPSTTLNGGFTQTSLNAGFPPTSLNGGFPPTTSFTPSTTFTPTRSQVSVVSSGEPIAVNNAKVQLSVPSIGTPYTFLSIVIPGDLCSLTQHQVTNVPNGLDAPSSVSSGYYKQSFTNNQAFPSGYETSNSLQYVANPIPSQVNTVPNSLDVQGSGNSVYYKPGFGNSHTYPSGYEHSLQYVTNSIQSQLPLPYSTGPTISMYSNPLPVRGPSFGGKPSDIGLTAYRSLDNPQEDSSPTSSPVSGEVKSHEVTSSISPRSNSN